jgi:hypothetical protein
MRRAKPRDFTEQLIIAFFTVSSACTGNWPSGLTDVSGRLGFSNRHHLATCNDRLQECTPCPHSLPLLRQIVVSVVVSARNILKRVIAQAVPNQLVDTQFSHTTLAGPPQVTGRELVERTGLAVAFDLVAFSIYGLTEVLDCLTNGPAFAKRISWSYRTSGFPAT